MRRRASSSKGAARPRSPSSAFLSAACNNSSNENHNNNNNDNENIHSIHIGFNDSHHRHDDGDDDDNDEDGCTSSVMTDDGPLGGSGGDRFLAAVQSRLADTCIITPPAEVVHSLLSRFSHDVDEAVELYCTRRMEWKGGDVDVFHASLLEQVKMSGGEDVQDAQMMQSQRMLPGTGEISTLAALYASMPDDKKRQLFDVEFEELYPMPPVPYLEPPKLSSKQPYWLMRLLLDTLLNGGYLVSGLYIPHEVWFQKGAKLHGQQAKINFIAGLTEQLQFLSKMELDHQDSLIIVLQNFNTRCQKLYDTLSKQLPSKAPKNTQSEVMYSGKESEMSDDGSSKNSGGRTDGGSCGGGVGTPLEKTGKNKLLALGKDIYKKTKKNFKKELQKASANRERKIEKQLYIPSLITLFEKSQFIGRWVDDLTEDHVDERGYVHIEDHTRRCIFDEIEKISFFFMLVLRKFILRDMFVLIERYMKKARESTSRLFPKKFKWE